MPRLQISASCSLLPANQHLGKLLRKTQYGLIKMGEIPRGGKDYFEVVRGKADR